MGRFKTLLGLQHRIDISKSYTFKCSLAEKFKKGSLIEPPEPACEYCRRKDLRQCFCNSFKKLIGKTQGYEIPELQSLKDYLLKVCHKLDNLDIYQWNCHTNRTNEDSKIINEIKKVTKSDGHNGSELVTVAWAKLYEILMQCDLLQLPQSDESCVISTLHLCEIPGAFVCATNHFIKSINEFCQLDWKAISLNPFFEGNDSNQTLVDDTFLRETSSHWLFGADDSGDLLKKENIEHIWGQTSRSENQWQASFITADGSISVQHDPSNQESITASLHLAEFVCCLGVLKLGGSFVLKMFTLLEHSSISILSLFSLLFSQVAIVKPMLSKAGNSEVYVIGIHFLGIRSSLLRSLIEIVGEKFTPHNATFPRKWIPDEFISEIINCNKLFIDWQVKAINYNLRTWEEGLSDDHIADIEKTKKLRSIEFIRMFDIRPLSQENMIVPKPIFGPIVISTSKTNEKSYKKIVGSLLKDRHSLFLSEKEIRVKRLKNWMSGNSKLIFFTFDTSDKLELPPTLQDLDASSKNFFNQSRATKIFSAHHSKINLKNIQNNIKSKSSKILFSILKNQSYLYKPRSGTQGWKFVFTKRLEPCSLNYSKFIDSYEISNSIETFQNYPYSMVPVGSYSDYLMSSSEIDPNLSITGSMICLLLCLQQAGSLLTLPGNFRYNQYMEIGVQGADMPLFNLVKFLGLPLYSVILKIPSKFYSQPKATHDPQTNFRVKEAYIPITIDLTSDKRENTSIRDRLVQKIRGLIIDDSSKCDLIHLDIVSHSLLFREIAASEIESKFCLISGLIVALNSIKSSGDMIILMSTSLTRFTVGIVFLLSLAFESLQFIHPSSISRFSLRQYLFCKNFIDSDQSVIRRFLQYLIEMIYSSNLDCIQIFDPLYLTDEEFFNWIKENNNEMIRASTEDLNKRSNTITKSKFFWCGSPFFMNLNQYPNYEFFIAKYLEKDHGTYEKQMDPWDGIFLCK